MVKYTTAALGGFAIASGYRDWIREQEEQNNEAQPD
jgi:hypothetical protein